MRPPHLSHSQLKTFKACARKWGLLKIDHLEDKPSAAKDFGIAVHALLETYLRTHIPIPGDDAPAIAARATVEQAFPKLGLDGEYPTAQAEVEFSLELEGAPLVGFIDVLDSYPDHPLVVDYKTKGNFRYIGKEPLGTDQQMILYAKHAFGVKPTADVVTVCHVYILAPPKDLLEVSDYKPKIRIASDDIRRSDMLDLMAPIEALVKDVTKVWNAETGMELPRSPEHCSAFGGCPFLDRCWNGASPTDRMFACLDEAPASAPIVPPDARIPDA